MGATRLPARAGGAPRRPSADRVRMAPLALALQLALASPGLAPPLDPGPFRGGELALASVGVLGGDVLVLGAGYLTLQLFADGAISPSAQNFRRAALVMGVFALVVPPLVAVLLAKVGARSPAAGAFWRALLLAAAGQAAALAVGYYAAPHFWLTIPIQLATVSVGTSLGLHWGRRRAPPVAPALGREAAVAPPREAAVATPMCP